MLPKLELLPESSSYSATPNNSVVSVQLEGGVSRSRLDLVNVATLVDCQWVLDRKEYFYLSVFFNSIVMKGVNPFLIDLIIDKPYKEERVAKFVPETFRMHSPVGLSFICEATLEVAPSSDPEFDEALGLLWPEMEDHWLLGNTLEQFANYGLDTSP